MQSKIQNSMLEKFNPQQGALVSHQFGIRAQVELSPTWGEWWGR